MFCFQAPGRDFSRANTTHYCGITIALRARFQLLLSWWSGQRLSPCLSFPVQPETEQILARPYQREPQRARVEVEQMLRGEQLLGEAANDRPLWQSLTLGLWRCHDRLSAEDRQPYHVIPMLIGGSSCHTESTKSPWHPGWLIIIQSGSSQVVGKWDWWLQGHWIRFAGKEQSQSLAATIGQYSYDY